MQDPEQTPKSKRWMIMLGVVILLFILYYIASYAINGKSLDRDQKDPQPGSSINQDTQKSTTDIDRNNEAPLAPSTNETSQNQQPVGNSIIDTNLLTAPVPQDATVAREEISRLQDQQAQLTERKALQEQQLKDSDKLVELKEKYLADLQAQLDKSNA